MTKRELKDIVEKKLPESYEMMEADLKSKLSDREFELVKVASIVSCRAIVEALAESGLVEIED